ncbi:MAG: hypothetical protein WCX71_05385 [Candidatus Buchananbacteria bacterium]
MCKYKEKTGDELVEEAKELGLSEDGWYEKTPSPFVAGSFREAALQARVREAKKARRENHLWIIAMISAIASLFSAIAAWIAALK